jgi:hypothetical protein
VERSLVVFGTNRDGDVEIGSGLRDPMAISPRLQSTASWFQWG